MCLVYQYMYPRMFINAMNFIVSGQLTRLAAGAPLSESSFHGRLLYEGCTVPTHNMECERIHYRDIPSAHMFARNYTLPRWPVVIETGPDGFGGLGWRTHLWDDDYLARAIGHVNATFEVKGEGVESFGVHSAKERHTVSEFLRGPWSSNASGGTRWYLNLQPDAPPGLTQLPLSLLSADFAVPHFFLGFALRSANLWMGRADPVRGGASALHHDGSDNVYAVVQGRKRVTLFSPDDSFNLYVDEALARITGPGVIEPSPLAAGASPNFSPIGALDRADLLALFPRVARARAMTCELLSGQMLYIPAGWWHFVRSFDRSIAINFWAEPPPVALAGDRHHCSDPTRRVPVRGGPVQATSCPE